MCVNITITFKFTTVLLLPGTFIMLPFPFGDKAKLKLKIWVGRQKDEGSEWSTLYYQHCNLPVQGGFVVA